VTANAGINVGVLTPTGGTQTKVWLADTEVVDLIVIATTELCFLTPLRVALTKSPTFPLVLPAVKVTEAPVVALSLPKVLLVRVHEYVVPVGQLEVHVGVAVNFLVPPWAREAEVGLTDTEVRVDLTAITTTELCLVTPLRVALTNSPIFPFLVPAVKVTAAPVVALSVPRVLLVRVHEYVVPDGHVEVHIGVAVKVAVAECDRVADVGLTDTEVRVEVVVVTVIELELVANGAPLCAETVSFPLTPVLPAVKTV
jgi:hypothetical protein